jgi:hypothetical protein
MKKIYLSLSILFILFVLPSESTKKQRRQFMAVVADIEKNVQI